MRSLIDMDTIQIELTNACIRSCSNCTRFCGHVKPFYMTKDQFQLALQSMKGFPKMIGFMGGEPLLHPQFEEFCTLAREAFEPYQLGLWTSLPQGKEHHADVICETFGHIFINDHTREDIYHAPILVGAEEIFPDPKEMYYAIDHCWLQNAWSASINPRGAFFCEIAASMSILFDEGRGWPVEEGWWYRTPKDFTEQIERYCPRCGVALPLARRLSIDGRDDVSPKNLERLHGRSMKIDRGDYVLSDLQLVKNPEPMAAYKDTNWRNTVAARYGIHLVVNKQRFWTPLRVKKPLCVPTGTIFDQYKKRMEV